MQCAHTFGQERHINDQRREETECVCSEKKKNRGEREDDEGAQCALHTRHRTIRLEPQPLCSEFKMDDIKVSREERSRWQKKQRGLKRKKDKIEGKCLAMADDVNDKEQDT